MVRELKQRRGRTTSGLSTFVAPEPAGQIMDKGRRGVRQNSEIHVTSRLAARALDFKPWTAAVDRLVDRR